MDYHSVKFANSTISPVMTVDYAKSVTNVRRNDELRATIR
jgi:hypothetical protein